MLSKFAATGHAFGPLLHVSKFTGYNLLRSGLFRRPDSGYGINVESQSQDRSGRFTVRNIIPGEAHDFAHPKNHIG
jgi:hypothetical protein